MTTTSSPAPSSGSSATQSTNGATRNSTGGATSTKPGQGHRTALDFFAQLLGQATTSDAALANIDVATDATDATGGLHTGRKKAKAGDTDSDNPLAGANPLADLIGWSPATVAPLSGKTAKNHAGTADADTGEAAIKAGTPGLAGAPDGVPLTGMTALAQPVEADADLLAGIKAAAHGQVAAAELPTPIEGSTASDEVSIEIHAGPHDSPGRNIAGPAKGTTAWRSTATIGASYSRDSASAGGASGQPSATTALQIAQTATAQRGMPTTDNALPTLRSTVALDNRFNGPLSAESPLSGPLSAGEHARGSQGDSNTPGQRDASFAMAHTEGGEHTAADEAFLLDGQGTPEDVLDPNELLNPGQLRHASVRVGDGTDEAIDIRLSLEGDTVSVNFRTDNADVRAGLNHHAGASLSDLMQRSGLQLSDVSVGAQSQPSFGQSGQPGQPGGSQGQAGPKGISGKGHGGNIDTTDLSRSSTGRPPPTRRADGGPALDVFA